MNPSTPAKEDPEGVRIEEILNDLAQAVSDSCETEDGYRIHTTHKPIVDARTAIMQLIAEAERRGRRQELEAFRRMVYPNESPFGNQYLFDYANDRIWNLNALQSKSETGKE